ncbi:MAG TPA: tetratricopeptide repeat protein [Thermoanaerobaculia bacterium]|nr:tetratricopeptide repeat protein [Thermoanaerobaculia bacterium]
MSIGKAITGCVLAGVLAAAPALAAKKPARADREAALHFLDARLAESEGEIEAALVSYGRAVQTLPTEPFVRLEYARLAGRAALQSRSQADRGRRLDVALEQLRAARQLAGGDFQVLKEAGLLYLELARDRNEVIPAAQEALEAAREIRGEDPEVLLPLGQIYRANGDLPRAVETFRLAERKTAGAPWAKSLLVRSLSELAEARDREGKGAEREALLSEAFGLDPDNVEVRANLAEVASRRGRHTEAASLLGAIEPDLMRPELRQRWVWELYLSGDLEAAARAIDRLSSPDPEALRSLRILLLAARLQIEPAVGEVAQLVQGDRAASQVAISLVRALSTHGHTAAAGQLADGLVNRLAGELTEEAEAALRIERAELAVADQAWKVAEAVLAPLAASGGKGALGDGWKVLWAEALFRLGRADGALASLPSELGTGTEERTQRSVLVAKRVEILHRTGRAEEAATALRELAGASEPLLVLQAARVLQRLERFAEAIPVLERLLSLDGGSIEGAYFLGVAFERTGERERSVTTFQNLVHRAPDFAPALNFLGYMWAEKGENLEQALALTERAVSLDPENGAFVDSLGWAHFQLGRLDEARRFLEKAARLLPEDATVAEHLGDVYRAMGERELARNLYRRTIDLDPAKKAQVEGKLAGLEARPPG